jgi:uncharacterized damage-inducible protein DinB
MQYPSPAIPDALIPRAADPMLQHVVDTYAGEINKVVSVWRQFAESDLAYAPAPASSPVVEIMRHELLSGRRFFANMLDAPEPPPEQVLPQSLTPEAFAARLIELAIARLPALAGRTDDWWLEEIPFFDVRRQRIWIFWRRVLHTAHHRTQLTVYLRLLGRPVPPTYGPTADVKWDGADPTTSVDAAGR